MRIKLILQPTQVVRQCEEDGLNINPGQMYYRVLVFDDEIKTHALCMRHGGMISDLPEQTIEDCDTFDELMHEAEWYDREMRQEQMSLE